MAIVWKCDACHHEWERHGEIKCNWCGSTASVIGHTKSVSLGEMLILANAAVDKREREREKK